ncbi:MAG: DUF4012 domain-containing protein [Actinomycetota bacterium]
MVVLAAAGAILAALGGAAPTGIGLVDLVYTGAVGAALVLAAGRSRRLAWIASAVLALWITPHTVGRIIALLAIAAGLYAVRHGRRRLIGAAIGAALAFVLGDLGAGPFHGSTVLFAAVAGAPILIGGGRLMPRSWRRPFAVAAGYALAAAAIATALFGLAAFLAVGDVGDGIDDANAGFDAASDGDQQDAAAAFDAASDSFESARSKVSGFWTLPARLVPMIGQNARAIQVTAAEGVALTAAAGDTARSVDPDDIRLVDGALDLGLLEDLQPVLDRAERALDRADERVRDTRSDWLLSPLASRVDELLDELDDARPSARAASLAVDHLPVMLGGDGPVAWLVGLITPAEARGLGGLLGNWVLVTADDGDIEVTMLGRNEDVNRLLRERDVPLTGPDQYLDRWGFFEPNRFFQDVALSPDAPMVAEVTAALFDGAFDTAVDGVMLLDPYAIQAVLQIGGTVDTDDLTLGANEVVDFLLTDQYVRYAGDEAGRVDALNQLVEGAFDAFTTGALPGPRSLVDRFGPIIEQDRLSVWWRDGGGPGELIDVAGLDGAWPTTDGDVIGLVHQNAGQNKMDTYLERDLDYRLTIDDGNATGVIRVTLRNTLTDLTLPDAVIASNDQGFDLGTNVARLGVHTALRVRGATLDGDALDVNRQDAFGHEVGTILVEIPAGETRVVELRVEGPLRADGVYELTIPAQPLVNADTVTVTVTIDGSEYRLAEEHVLRADLVLATPDD